MRSSGVSMRPLGSHMIVAALIATVTFVAGFTLPGGYVQNGSNNQGMAVLATATRENFGSFTVQGYLWYGYALTMSAMTAMVFAFVEGLRAVLYPSSLLEGFCY
ncbi:hypothetical protein AAG906_013112 [Vitis piasezkii]